MSGGTAQSNGRLWGARARDWAEIQEGQFAAAFHAVLAHAGVGHGTLQLDAGCGSGMAAALSAALDAQVAGIDAAEGMLEIARERTPSGDFRQGDMEALPWRDKAVDLVTGFNAFQFAGDPVKALHEAGRVTRPGGMVVVTPWRNPAGIEAASLIAVMKPMLPPATAGAPNPFALSDETALRSSAIAGGLTPLTVFDVDSPWFYRDEPPALRGVGAACRATLAKGVSVKPRSTRPSAPRWPRSGKPMAAFAMAPGCGALSPHRTERTPDDRHPSDPPSGHRKTLVAMPKPSGCRSAMVESAAIATGPALPGNIGRLREGDTVRNTGSASAVSRFWQPQHRRQQRKRRCGDSARTDCIT